MKRPWAAYERLSDRAVIVLRLYKDDAETFQDLNGATWTRTGPTVWADEYPYAKTQIEQALDRHVQPCQKE